VSNKGRALVLEKPEYPDRRSRAEEPVEVAEDIAALVASVDRVVAEQQADRDQRERHEIHRAKRERVTVVIVGVAAVIALGALAVSYHDTSEFLREAGSTAAEQHADTAAVLAKTDAQITALRGQTDALRGQLDEMKTASAIWRSEFTGVMQLDNVRANNNPTGWLITSRWNNIGKTDVLGFKGWNHLQFFPSVEDVKKIDFLKVPKGENINEPQAIRAGDYMTYGTSQVTMAQAWDEMYGKGAIISWGYIEYDDIFGTHHTVQHCESWNFQYEPPAINMGLPQPLSLNCNRRT
jgi:hypothetical protein